MTIAIIASAALLFSFLAQYVWGAQPCVLCWYQRGVFAVLILTDALSWRWLTRGIAMMGLVLAVYQVGVEQHVWHYPGCVDHGSVLELAGKSEAEQLQLLKQQAARPMTVGCDQVVWRILGVPASVWTVFLLIFMNGVSWYGCRRHATRQPRR